MHLPVSSAVDNTNPLRHRHIGEARKQFFFEKKNQKTLTPLVSASDTTGASRSEQKFFGAFFQKSTASFALAFLRSESLSMRALHPCPLAIVLGSSFVL
jgi:hypothetical protein